MFISKISKENAMKLGIETNRLQTVEECGELIKAICKYNRTQGVGQKTETSKKEAFNNLIEEIADVSICLEQMIYLNNFEECVKSAREKAFKKVADRYSKKTFRAAEFYELDTEKILNSKESVL